MKISTRWLLGVPLLVFAALGAPRAVAQTRPVDPSIDGGAGGDATVATSSLEASAVAVAVESADAASPGALVSSGASSPSSSQDASASPSAISPSQGLSPTEPQVAVRPRLAPTADQLAALRLLEDEISGFAQRGEAYRSGVNGLLRREHESQLDRLRTGFQRQIDSERQAESQARRSAISIFERFIENYPTDAEHTPDVMFRLAELYYDEAKYAKIEADERYDRQREAAGQSGESLQPPPGADYRCSILLYRHIAQRFPAYRLRDTTHYLLGWVLKEMGREDEAIGAYRSLVCPNRFQYRPRLDLTAPLADGQVPPLSCQRIADVLRPYAPELTSPAPAVIASAEDAGADEGGASAVATVGDEINQSLVAAGPSTDTEPMPIPTDYAQCQPLNGANGRPSRYTAETWYFIGDYHFDNPPTDLDLGNAYAIAAYQASMRFSEAPRLPGTQEARPSGGTSGAALDGADSNDPGTGVNPANSPGRSQFDANIQYGQFWSKSLYKIGWGFFRMQNGYPRALQSFSRLLDYFDYVGLDETTRGSRSDTIKWIGVIFSESTWSLAPSNEQTECQSLVETLARPPAPQVGENRLPFDCAGLVRITSPFNAVQLASAPQSATQGVAGIPIPGRVAHIPQDRPWTPEAYLELGNDYFQQTKYYEAIALYRLFLRMHPLHFMAPRVAENIALSYERQRQFDAAIDARGALASYLEGGEWYRANNAHPDAQRHAEIVARNSLYDTALEHHRRASRARTRSVAFNTCAQGTAVQDVCEAARNPRAQGERQAVAFSELQRANQEYQLAADAYTNFIRNYPNDDASYEFKYNRADALFWSARYSDAARAYGEVRESNENDQYLAASAYMAIRSVEASIRADVLAGRLDPCLAVRAGIDISGLRNAQRQPFLDAAREEQCKGLPLQPTAPTAAPAGAGAPAAAQGNNPAPPAQPQILELNLPESVRALMDARISYVRRVPRPQDSARGLSGVFQSDGNPLNDPPFRSKYAYLNARTQMRFGHTREAEEAYRGILRTFCTDQVVAGAAFADLFNMLFVQGRTEDRDALALEQSRGGCRGVDQSQIAGVLTDRTFRLALDLFRNAERATGDEALRLYERAANDLLLAVNSNRTHKDAPLALFFTALAYERTNRFDTATQTYIRITQDFNNLNVNGSTPPRELEGGDRQQRIDLLEQAHFRAGVNLDRTFDYESAVRYFDAVVRDARFASANDHAEHVHEALGSIALIHTNTGNWARARDAWRAFLPVAEAGRERATAEYRVAEMPWRARDWQGAVRAFQEYRRTTPMSSDTAEFHVQAQYNTAQALRNAGDQNGAQRELRRVAEVFRQSRQQPGSRAAAFAAEALFVDLDTRVRAFMTRTLSAGTGTELARAVRALKVELDGIDTQAGEIIDLQGGEYTLGALVRRGEAHEYLATQEVRISTLLRLSTAQQRQLSSVEASATRLEGLADQIGGRNQTVETRLRNQAQELRDRVQQMRDGMTTQIQQQYDQEAEAERKLAIQDFAVAIHLARRNNIPTQFAATALEHIRLEENRPLIDAAVRGLSAELAARIGFRYTPEMFSTEAPGVTITQQQAIATPGLVGE
jgi:tetratricopeptide (TPR) repeat protein